jgi:hypothetical protein
MAAIPATIGDCLSTALRSCRPALEFYIKYHLMLFDLAFRKLDVLSMPFSLQVVKLYEELSQAFTQSFGQSAARPVDN